MFYSIDALDGLRRAPSLRHEIYAAIGFENDSPGNKAGRRSRALDQLGT